MKYSRWVVAVALSGCAFVESCGGDGGGDADGAGGESGEDAGAAGTSAGTRNRGGNEGRCL